MVFSVFAATATVVQDYAYNPSRVVAAANASMGGYSRYAADAIGEGSAFDPRTMAASDEKWFWGLLLGFVLWKLFSFVREQRALDSATQALADRACSNRKVKGARARRIKEEGKFRELKDPMAREIAMREWRPDLAVGASEETERAEKAAKDYAAKKWEKEPPKPKGNGKKHKKY